MEFLAPFKQIFFVYGLHHRVETSKQRIVRNAFQCYAITVTTLLLHMKINECIRMFNYIYLQHLWLYGSAFYSIVYLNYYRREFFSLASKVAQMMNKKRRQACKRCSTICIFVYVYCCTMQFAMAIGFVMESGFENYV